MTKQPKSLNIGIIHSSKFPWNRGIGQLYCALEELGHHPIVLSIMNGQSGNPNMDGRFRFQNMRNGSNFLSRLRTYPNILNPFWKNFIYHHALHSDLDCLFVRETNVVRQALAVAKKTSLPIFLDMRENRSLRLKSDLSIHSRFGSCLIKHFESIYLPKCIHIFTVTEELREWVISMYNISPDKITVLGNYPDVAFLSKVMPKRKNYDLTDSIKLVFAGTITENRGLQDIIDCFPLVLAKFQCTFTIIGEGNYLPALKERVDRLNLGTSISFIPMLPPDEVPTALSLYDIGIASYLLNDFTNLTMPGKLYEYMAAGLPVLTSARRPVVRIVSAENCGIIYETRNPTEIADKIISMIENVDEREKMSINGIKAIRAKYNNKVTLNILRTVLDNNLAD